MTPNLNLPYLAAAQAQKHVTHNEALRALDAVVQLSVLDRDLTMPPAAPTEGARYLVASGASGAWSGKSGAVAAYQDGAWAFHIPRVGWQCFIADEGVTRVWNGSAWLSAAGLDSAQVGLNLSANGASNTIAIIEEEVPLSGAFTDTSITIPNRAIVFAVSVRTTQAITGASSYGCGVAGDTVKYGGLLGTAAGSNNSGVTVPTAYYAATPVRLTANGGNFTAGKVRVAIHYLTCGVSTS